MHIIQYPLHRRVCGAQGHSRQAQNFIVNLTFCLLLDEGICFQQRLVSSALLKTLSSMISRTKQSLKASGSLPISTSHLPRSLHNFQSSEWAIYCIGSLVMFVSCLFYRSSKWLWAFDWMDMRLNKNHFHLHHQKCFHFTDGTFFLFFLITVALI